MKILPFAQGSVEWSIARAAIPTASEFDQLLTPDFKIRTGQMPETYLAKKLAEKWIGGPLPSFNTLDMDFGEILENEAIPWYELELGEKIQRVGLITTDCGKIGCSPDGLLGEDGGIEIKCPAIHTHVGYLLNGVLPKDYACQVHGAMYVTGRQWWKFLSYRRHLPPLLITIFRDDKIQEQIGLALVSFLRKLDETMARLIEINGGPPTRQRMINNAPQYESDEMDVPIP